MKKQNFIHRLLTKMLKKLGIITAYEAPCEEMCKDAIIAGVCPGMCETCAWYLCKGER